MRIIIPSIKVPFIRGGAELMVEGLYHALKRRGHEIEIVSTPFKFFPEGYLEDLIDFWINQDFNSFNGRTVDRIIALQFPAYFVKHRRKVIWLMHQHRVCYDLYVEKTASEGLKKLSAKIRKADNEHLSREKQLYTMSLNVTRRLRRFNNIPSIPLYHPPKGEEHFYSEEPYDYIFYPSRHERLKRQDLLIHAMKYITTPVKAIIAGEGGRTPKYQSLIEELKLQDKVRLIGSVSDEEKYTLYARSLAVFFAPYDEDYGYVTLEAMLASKTIITCADSGGPLEFVRDSETGFVVGPDPKEISFKIDWLYSNKKKAEQMGRTALKAYRAHNMSWENVVDKLLAVSE